MLKKFLAAIFLSFFCFTINFSNAEARIANSQVALGGIVPGCKMSSVISIYGQPDEIDISNKYDLKLCYYGKKNENADDKRVTIELSPNSVGLNFTDKALVQRVKVVSNNGFKTPDNIHVGSSLDEVLSIYGKPDYENRYGTFTLDYYSEFFGLKFWIGEKTRKVTGIEIQLANKDTYYSAWLLKESLTK